MKKKITEKMKIAEREMLPHHKCPYCGKWQEDEGEPGDEWECAECGKKYLLGDC